MVKPVVTVVMPAFNAAQTITASIESVICQTFTEWELIIIDDDSADATQQIAQDYCHRYSNVTLLTSGGRQGPAVARNIGIAAARGVYIAFLDSDDLWLPRKLELQVEFMEKTKTPLSYTSYYKMGPNGRRSQRPIVPPASVDYFDLLKSNCIGCLTAMYDSRAFPEARMPNLGKREDLRFWLDLLKGKIGHEDYGFWLSLMRRYRENYVIAKGLDIPLAIYRVGTGSLSGNKARAAMYQWFVYRELENLSIWASIYYFAHYAIRGLHKYLIR